MTTTAPQGSWISVPVKDGTMDCYRVDPAGTPRGGIVLLQEIFGVNDAMRDKAQSFAADGFTVLLPDLFWRNERQISLGYDDADRRRGFALMQSYDQAAGSTDIRAAVSWLKTSLGGKPVALIGFCLGGRMAVLAGAGHTDTAAVVSLYGVRLDLCGNQLDALTQPFQLHVGSEDAHVPAEHVAAVKQHLAAKTDATIHIYPGAQHGFFNRLRHDVYNPAAATEVRQHIDALLRRVAP